MSKTSTGKTIIKHIIIGAVALIPILAVLLVVFFVRSYNSIDQNRIAGDNLRDKGPWTQGGIWVSDDGNNYLVTVEETSTVYFYTYVNDVWIRDVFSAFPGSPAGKCWFDISTTKHYELFWEAYVDDDVLTLKTEMYPFLNGDRLPCDKKIVFRKTAKTADELPFAEDFNALCAHIEELMEKH